MMRRLESWKDFLKELCVRMGAHDCAGLAAEMAYNWMLALPPLLIFCFTLFGMWTSNPHLFELVLNALQKLAPSGAYTVLRESLIAFNRDSTSGLALISLLGLIWVGSNGATVIEKALNRAYGCEERRRNFWRRRLVALIIMLGIAGILLLCANLIVFGDAIYRLIHQAWQPSLQMLKVMGFLRWGIPVLGLILASGLIYTLSPEQHQKKAWKQIWPGTLTFVLLWISISWLFTVYVNTLGAYSKVYGSMGTIVVLLIWLYLTAYALLIGGEINALIYQRLQHLGLHIDSDS